MTDYVSILSRSITDKASYDERRGVYERARQALVAQLRALDPPLSESEITKQRLALETAIRTVEAQAAVGKIAPAPSAGMPQGKPAESAAGPPAARREGAFVPLLAARAQSSLSELGSIGDTLLARMRTFPSAGWQGGRRPGNWLIGLILIALVGVGGVVTAWLVVKGSVSSMRNASVIISGGKIEDRQGSPLQAQNTAAVAQTAYLTEENVEAPKGADIFHGKVTWRIDSETNPQGQGPERVIQGLVEIPERNLRMLMTVRRNTDAALPASHTIVLLFDVPQNFVHGAIESVAGLRMKPSEQANGLPLVSAAVRITTGYFLLGLNSAQREQNVVLLRDRPWIDVLILYRNGRRAVLTIEKGIQGDKVFADAFKSWGD